MKQMNNIVQHTPFSIKIDFDQNQRDPGRIFTAMAGLIEAIDAFNKDSILTIDSTLEPVLLLDDFEKGSIRVLFKELLEATDDDALKSGDVKKVIGSYLVKAKYLLLNFMNQNNTINNVNQLEELQADIFKLAKDTKSHHIPHYKPIPIPKLVSSMDNIQNALRFLKKTDEASFEYTENTDQNISIPFNQSFGFDKDKMDEVLTKEEIVNTSESIIKIKKPDYLGESMWDFLHCGKIIQAKIADESWLKIFQNGDVQISPGDCLRVKMEIKVKYDHNNDIIGIPRYNILKVLKILRKGDYDQLHLNLE